MFLVNLLFFVQGIGTSAGLLLGRHPSAAPRSESRQTASVWRDGRFYMLVCIFGFYFIAEHGMLN